MGYPDGEAKGKFESQVSGCARHVFTKSDINQSSRPLLGTLGRKYDQYLDFAQQDAHEFLRILLDAMRMEELDVGTPIPGRSLLRRMSRLDHQEAPTTSHTC
jgi:uncharacterized UBP type Zn finger protein